MCRHYHNSTLNSRSWYNISADGEEGGVAVVWLTVVSDCVQHHRSAVKSLYWLSVLHVAPDLLSSRLLQHFLGFFRIIRVYPVVIRLAHTGMEIPEVKKKKRCYRDTRGKRMQVVTVFCELWLKYDAGNKCDCRLWAPTVGFLLYQYALCYLIWSGVKNIQCSHTILILVRKLNQLLPFYKLTTYGFTKPYAACCRLFSQISLLSFHCQSRLGFFYDPNSDGCIPVWNELAGCERGSSFASYCCHLVSGRKSTGTIRGDMRKLVCWRRTSLI